MQILLAAGLRIKNIWTECTDAKARVRAIFSLWRFATWWEKACDAMKQVMVAQCMLLPESAQLSASTGVGKKVKRTSKKPKQSAIAAQVGVGTGSSNSKISMGGGAAQREVALAVLSSQRKFDYLEQLHKSLFQPLLAFDPRSSATYEDQDVPPRHVHDTDSLRSEGGGGTPAMRAAAALQRARERVHSPQAHIMNAWLDQESEGITRARARSPPACRRLFTPPCITKATVISRVPRKADAAVREGRNTHGQKAPPSEPC